MIVVYPGSFNPWHAGHFHVLRQAIITFDQVIIMVGVNPEKDNSDLQKRVGDIRKAVKGKYPDLNITVMAHAGLLTDFIQSVGAHAVIKGLRNIQDFEYEKTQQYWNEDLGINVPTFYVIPDRTLLHVSSSAIRAVKKATKSEDL